MCKCGFFLLTIQGQNQAAEGRHCCIRQDLTGSTTHGSRDLPWRKSCSEHMQKPSTQAAFGDKIPSLLFRRQILHTKFNLHFLTVQFSQPPHRRCITDPSNSRFSAWLSPAVCCSIGSFRKKCSHFL